MPWQYSSSILDSPTLRGRGHTYASTSPPYIRVTPFNAHPNFQKTSWINLREFAVNSQCCNWVNNDHGVLCSLCKKPDMCVLRSPLRFPLVILTNPHLSTPSAVWESEEQPLISKDSPTQFRCVVTASSGDVVSSCVFGVLDLYGKIQ